MAHVTVSLTANIFSLTYVIGLVLYLAVLENSLFPMGRHCAHETPEVIVSCLQTHAAKRKTPKDARSCPSYDFLVKK